MGDAALRELFEEDGGHGNAGFHAASRAPNADLTKTHRGSPSPAHKGLEEIGHGRPCFMQCVWMNSCHKNEPGERCVSHSRALAWKHAGPHFAPAGSPHSAHADVVDAPGG